MLSFNLKKLFKSLLLIILIFQFIGCAAGKHGWTTERYKGHWLKVSKDGSKILPGNIRLKIERDYDPSLDLIVSMKGDPDYIHVINTNSVELVYLDENKIYQYKRSSLNVNSKLIKTYEAAEAVRAGYIPEFDKKITHQTKIKKDTIPEVRTILQNKWAIIIGISKYQFSGQNGLTNLVFADDDAKVFARSLYNLGWSESHVKLLINEEATRRKIMIALKSWLTKAGPEDQIILFWAGHGYPDPEDFEKVYLATHDTDISIPATGYRMDEVRRALEEIGSKNVILLADTCHAGKLITRGDSSRGISIVPNINKMVREQKVPKGWVFMVGADTDRQSIEHTSWSNGAFTHVLIKGLNGDADGFQSAGVNDGVVTLGELRAYMNTVMPDETQKILGVAKRPVITTSTGDPDIWNLTLQAK